MDEDDSATESETEEESTDEEMEDWRREQTLDSQECGQRLIWRREIRPT
jgi:hypothetical protein